MIDKNYITLEEGIEKFKGAINIRNKMGGALYYNIIDDECLQLADKLVDEGADRKMIAEIGGWELKY